MRYNDPTKTISEKLFKASAEGNIVEIENLIRTCDVDINRTNEDGKTPLHIAAENGHVDAIKTLVELGGRC